MVNIPSDPNEQFPFLSRYLENTAPVMRLAAHYTADGKECILELYRVEVAARIAGKIVQVRAANLTSALQELDDSCRINFKAIDRENKIEVK